MQCRTCGEFADKEGLSLLEPQDVSLLPQADGSCSDFVCHACIVEIQHWRNFLSRFQTSQKLFQQVLATSDHDSSQQTACPLQLAECRVLVTKLLHCDSCSFYTNNKSQLESHMQTHLTTAGGSRSSQPTCNKISNQRCSHCNMRYDVPELLSWHVRNCHGAQATVKAVKINNTWHNYQCRLCKTERRKVDMMIDHLQTEHGICDLPFVCNVCDVRFITKARLQLHQSKKHQISPIHRLFKMFKCDQCKARYVQRGILDWHTKYCHGSDAVVKMIQTQNHKRKYQCTFCKTVFAQTHNIIFHLSSKHGFKDLPHKCDGCEKQFEIMHSLRVHQLTCIGSCGYKDERLLKVVNIVKCKMCSASFGSETNLKKHITKIHAKLQVKCRHCEQSFSSNKQLFKHCHVKHPGEIILKCKFCDLEFASYNGYFFHTKYKHNSSHDLSCKICSKTFTYPEALKRHVDRIHNTENKSFKCYICGVSFICKQYLTKHIQGVHTGKFLHCHHCKYKTRMKALLIGHFKRMHFKTPAKKRWKKRI